jgi:signal transduction histidine kinase
LLHTVLENAGADKGVLLMPHDHQWFVEAVATVDQPAQIQAIALSSSSEVPQSLINTVKRSREAMVIIDASVHPTIATDVYVVQHQPKSLLCTPILLQGKLVAILYLENHLTVGAFTRDRIQLLNFLCTQAAISLENARLYQQAQNYAQQIEQSQLQIVQSEKMASLGNLVAGVAHEINNPIGFLNGSINNGKDYVQDLLGHLALYQQHYPDPVAPIQDNAEEIDLEFLGEDLPKLLDSMKGACDRIKSISTSLRTFSRADTEHKISANLHEGIDSTLLILKYRLKANENRPAIEVIQNYGDLPTIQCFPGQLNQVFINIHSGECHRYFR